MKKQSMAGFKRSAQAGFTLIELVVVIVILGILAATALPKFADLGTDARIAKMQAAGGALKSASAIAHSQWLASGSTGTTATLDGAAITLVNGYPAGGAIAAAAGLSAPDYSISGTTTVTVLPDATRTACKITYAEAASAGAAPVIDAAALTTANCD